MPTVKITKRAVDAIAADTPRTILWDSELKGFGLVALPAGSRTFVVDYRNAAGRKRRYTLGRYGALTPDEARKAAREALGRVASGHDPAEVRSDVRSAPSVASLLDRYIREHARVRNKASTVADVIRIVDRHLKPRIGHIAVNAFTRKDAVRLHSGMSDTPRRANQTMAILSKAFSLAEDWGLRAENSNPCQKVVRYAENKRKRFLTADELARVGAALTEAETIGLPWQVDRSKPRSKHVPKVNQRSLLSWQAVAVVRLLLLTGARLSEILELEWKHVDTRGGTMALPDRKGGVREPHPVSDAALDLVGGLPRERGAKWVFPGIKDPKTHASKEVLEAAWQRLRVRAEVPDVRLHDLRHTVATHASQAGANAFVLRDLLRHANVATTGIYANKASDPIREVSRQLGETIMAALSPQPAQKKAEDRRAGKATAVVE